MSWFESTLHYDACQRLQKMWCGFLLVMIFGPPTVINHKLYFLTVIGQVCKKTLNEHSVCEAKEDLKKA